MNFESHVTHMLCFKIHTVVSFKICIDARVSQRARSHIFYIESDLIKFASGKEAPRAGRYRSGQFGRRFWL